MKSLRARSTDFYSIVPLPDNKYVVLIDNTVVGIYVFASTDEAEDYVLEYYEDLRQEITAGN